MTKSFIMDSFNQYPIAARSTESVFNSYPLNFPGKNGLEFSKRFQHRSDEFNNYVDDCFSPPTSTSTSPSSSDLISMPSELSDSRGSSSFNGILASDTEHSTSENSPIVHTTDVSAQSTSATPANVQRCFSRIESYAEHSSDFVSRITQSFPITATSSDPRVTGSEIQQFCHYGSASPHELSPFGSARIRVSHPVTTTYHSHSPDIPLPPSTHTCTANLEQHVYGHERIAPHDRRDQPTTSPSRLLRPSACMSQSDSLAAFTHAVPASCLQSDSLTRLRSHEAHGIPAATTTFESFERYLTQASTSCHYPSRRLFRNPSSQTACRVLASTVSESLSDPYGSLDSRILSSNLERTKAMRSVCGVQDSFQMNSKRRIENPGASDSHISAKKRRSTNKKERTVSVDTIGDVSHLLPRPLSQRDARRLLHESIVTTPNDFFPPLPKPLRQCFSLPTITATRRGLWNVDVNGCAISSNRKYNSFPYSLRPPPITAPEDSKILFTLTGLFGEVINTPDLLYNNFLISTRRRLPSRHCQMSNYCCPASPRRTRISDEDLLNIISTFQKNERSTTPPLAVHHRTPLLNLAAGSLQPNATDLSELEVNSEAVCYSHCVRCSQCEMQVMSADRVLHFKPNDSENSLTFCSLACLVNHQSSPNNIVASCTLSTASSTSTGVQITDPLAPDPNNSKPVLFRQSPCSRARKQLVRRGIGRRRQSNEPHVGTRNVVNWLGSRRRWGKTGWRRVGELPARSSNPPRSFKKPSPPGPPEPSWHLLASTSSNVDSRICSLCHQTGDAPNSVSGRLLNYDADTWIHLNCILWCFDVYETVDGGLEKVCPSVEKANNTYCSHCGLTGAGLPCYNVDCPIVYHVPCAHKLGCVFHADRSMYCQLHQAENSKSDVLETLDVKRRVFISRDVITQVDKVIVKNAHNLDSNQTSLSCMPGKLRIGSLILHSIGQLLPEQLSSGGFHNTNFIYPVGYASTRIYWSYRRVGHRCLYHCRIEEGLSNVSPKEASERDLPESPACCAKFLVTVEDSFFPHEHFVDKSCNGVWQQILGRINESRDAPKRKLMRICQQYVRGEMLFGLTEPHIVRAIESLPGVDHIENYSSSCKRLSLIKGMPLPINPMGCARAEPQLHVRNRRSIGDSVNSMSARLSVKCLGGPLSRYSSLASLLTPSPAHQSTVSKSQQYRHLQRDWRNNVNLARSKIQGLGLFASRKINRNAFIIEYLGEVIRNEVGNRRERLYQLQNRGIYMFRVDDDLIVDATMCGGLARYINHSCEPNCTAEILLAVDNGRQNSSIIIVARRDIQSGEELTYDYKLDVEEDVLDRIPCMCNARNCRKWMN